MGAIDPTVAVAPCGEMGALVPTVAPCGETQTHLGLPRAQVARNQEWRVRQRGGARGEARGLTGDWTQAKAAMLEFYGEGKEQTVGRWIRAAKGMDKGTIDLLKLYPKVKGAYVWDNSFLVVSTTRVRDKMSVPFAADAFKLLLEHDAELTARGFVEKVCRFLRLLDMWVCLMYSSVAALSPALARVTDHLRSWVGLASVRRCIEGSVVLHDTAGGIPECTLLVTEFDKCKAAGLPPPQRLPTDDKRQAEEIAAKKAAEAAEVAAKEAEKKERDEFEEAEAQRTAEVDMFVLSASHPQGIEHPDGIVGCSKTPAQIAAETNSFSLDLRCTESQCQWRPADKRDGAVDLAMDSLCEIAEEDRAVLMADMLADLDDQVGDADDQAAEQVDGHLKKRDAIVDLWPYAHPPAYYGKAITLLGAGVKRASWCPRPRTRAIGIRKDGNGDLGLDTPLVAAFLRPWTRLGERSCGIRGAGEFGMCSRCFAGVQDGSDAKKSGHDCRVVPTKLLVPGSQGLVRREAEKFQLRITTAHVNWTPTAPILGFRRFRWKPTGTQPCRAGMCFPPRRFACLPWEYQMRAQKWAFQEGSPTRRNIGRRYLNKHRHCG